jgi:RimJ/RimL family protein N-acetyltransferase
MLPTLETPRLALRPWRIAEAELVLKMYSRPEVVRYLGRNPVVLTELHQAEDRIRAWSTLQGPTHGVWAIVPNGQAHPVGTALLKILPLSGGAEPSGITEVGWHLHPDAWGHGYATEAGQRLLQHGWAQGLDRILAVTYPENLASQAVCLRLGMDALGQTEDYYDVRSELFSIAAPAVNS